MASSSPLDISHLNSTSGLLAVLDLNGKSIENMEDIDADQIIDVPDTPDQLVTRTTSARDCIEKDSILSVVGNPGSPKYLDEKCVVRPGDRGKLFNRNWYNRRLNFRSLKDASNPDEFEHRTDSCFHPSGHSFASMNDHLFWRSAADETSKHGANHSTGRKHIDKGKGLCTKFSSSVSCEEDSDCVDLTEQSKNEQIFQNGVPCGALVNLLPKEVKGRSLETSCCSSKTANRNYELMEEKNDYTFKVPTSGVDRGNQNNILCKSQREAEKCVPTSPHHIPLHRVAGQKRLVKNGCISPHNIAKAKQLAERLGHDSKGVELNDARRTIANEASCVIDISGSVSEDRKVKGKGVITHSSTSKKYDGKTLCLPGRNPTPHKEEANKEEANRTGHGSRSASDSLEGLGGWRSTRNRSKKLHLPSSDGTGGHPGRNNSFYTILNGNKVDKRDNKVVINNKTSCDSPEVEDQIPFRHGTTRPLSQTISSSVSEPDQGNGRHHTGNANIKRQRKLKSAPSHPGECSTSVVHGSEVVFLDSPGESSNLRSSGDQIGHRRRIRDMIIEIEDSHPERRANASQDFGCTIDGNSDARARQVEADEILARELQEQLYHESPVFDGGEVDANLAWTLQQSGQAQQDSSSGSRRDFLLRNSLNSRLYRSQIQNQVRRGNQARVPASNRMAQLRRRFRSQSPATISRERIVPFPVQMDLDRRMDILEALETAASDLSSTIRRSNIAGVRRDFNENDYEMLLALDENNHQHGGASVGQINSLPQSTVQTDTFEEACVICLETPTTGDIVRHLPCLHKFHKDCIDPWLSRRTSCPVCKSSIS